VYTLSNLEVNKGARQKNFRRGRGQGSGSGQTSGKGNKGQTARNQIKYGFEGGQMPLVRRIPKRGFKNHMFRVLYDCINVSELNRFENGTRIDLPTLIKEGLVPGSQKGGLKILGEGELQKKLTVVANKFTKAAEEKIKAAGGATELVVKPKFVISRNKKETAKKASAGKANEKKQK